MGRVSTLLGRLLTIFTSIVGLFCQMKLISSRFSMYSDDGSSITNHFDHDCLYVFPSDVFTSIFSTIPYCIRSNTLEEVKNDTKRCQGEALTFQTLQSINVTTTDLLGWNAAISTADRYGKYLVRGNTVDDLQVYCKCFFALEFGDHCQYKFSSTGLPDAADESFSQLVLDRNYDPERKTNDEITLKSITCYVGISCRNSLLCLDWRQICNGMVDCDLGEDEPVELCSQLEFHQCDPETEFRCQNGMCISFSVSDDPEQDCLDRSDKAAPLTGLSIPQVTDCSLYHELYCEDLACQWKEYSCGDSQCITYADATAGIHQMGKTCDNKRNIVLLKRLFHTDEQNACWTAMICLTGFSHLDSKIHCPSRSLAQEITQHCPDQFYFPPNPVVYSFVHFLYQPKNRPSWTQYTGPDFICYQSASCPKQLTISPTLFKTGLSCMLMNSTIFTWKNFYEYVIYLFSPCFVSANDTLLISRNYDKVYRCDRSNTFVSIHRVKDRRNDCFFGEDEDPRIDLCSLDSADLFICMTHRTECIRQSLVRDSQYDCSDGSDEYFVHSHITCQGKSCERRFQREIESSVFYPFEQICNGIVDTTFFLDHKHESDETDCEHWPYRCDTSPYTRCDQVWNCKDGSDEFECPTNQINIGMHYAFGCSDLEHYCIRFNRDGNDIDLTCLPLNRVADGVIDCIGSTDERFSSVCTKEYPSDQRKRFHCMNSSICITPEQVCDTIVDCPHEDDERVCPWLYKSNATEFKCNTSSTVEILRCSHSILARSYCQLREHFWFCDLIVRDRAYSRQYSFSIELYPLIDQKTKRSYSLMSHTEKASTATSSDKDKWICHQGYPLEMRELGGTIRCLCPSPYYGNYCQYQSDRITVFLKIQHLYYISPTTVFRLLLFLLDDQQRVISHEELVYHHRLVSSGRFLIYLLYERVENTSLFQRLGSKWVRIDSYIIQHTRVQYISSWLFAVAFPFLPVNRVNAILNLENELFQLSKCRKKCGAHGKCMYYLNARHLEYCWCDQGWLGDKCHLRYANQHLCHGDICASHSGCVILDDEKRVSKCVCPLGRFGDGCYIENDACDRVVCRNNGSCLPLDERSIGYTCICTEGYDGDFCQFHTRILNIAIPANVIALNHVPVLIVIYATTRKDMFFQRRVFYTNISVPSTLKAYGLVKYVFVQIFYNISHSSYYLIGVHQRPFAIVNTTIIASNQCQNVSTLFNASTMRDYSHLKRVKLYHLPCNNNHQLRCFFDEYRMCLCATDRNSVCYYFNHERDNCDYCENGGLCIQRDTLEHEWQFHCICPSCTFGTLCQFTTRNYFITMDILIGVEIKPDHRSFKDQSLVITLTFVLLVLILAFGTVSNTISFLILTSGKLQKVSCDFYLLQLTIVSEIGILTLLARYLYMLFSQTVFIESMDFLRYSCIILEYLVRLIPSLFDWFTVCISLERTYIVFSNTHSTSSITWRSTRITRLVIAATYLLNMATTMHRPFHMFLVGEPSLHSDRPRHPWCILRFSSNSWNTYEKFISIFHLVTPLMINLISITSFLVYKIKFQFTMAKRNGPKSLCSVIRDQLVKYRPILIGTMVVILLELPRCVLTLVYGCVQSRWQRYLYLNVYLISYIPLIGIVLIYILPSPKYRQHCKFLLRTHCRYRNRSCVSH